MAASLRASGDDVVTIEPYHSVVTRPLRSLRISLQVDGSKLPPYSPFLTPAEELIYEQLDGRRRLRVLADDISKRFKVTRKNCRVRCSRGGYLLFVHLWEGPGTKADRKRLEEISAYVVKVARKI